MVAVPRRCTYRLWREGAMRQCARTFPVRTWTSHGQEVTACHQHEAEVRHRYPETAPMTIHERLHEDRRDPECEDCVHEGADDMTQAKAYEDWTESELRGGWGK